MKDFQRQRLYDWEERTGFNLVQSSLDHAGKKGVGLNDVVPMPEAAELVSELFRRYGAVKGIILLKPGKSQKLAWASYSAITLPRWARTPWIVAHEVSHLFAHDLHGPQFCYVFSEMVLLAAQAVTGAKKKELPSAGLLRASMRRAGLKVSGSFVSRLEVGSGRTIPKTQFSSIVEPGPFKGEYVVRTSLLKAAKKRSR